ncbi:MAG TPA: acyl-CoA dehydrogenase family protein [Stellaceae bacterium]|jgi:hypothetical protein|nr:acyl-CoA dehydrogenase family protein [Stellaceae bacterium]
MPEGDWRGRAVTGDDWVARARALEPLVEQYRDEGEALRQLPRPLFEAMRDAGLFHLWVPRAYGGAEVDIATMVRVTEEVSRQDGAAGWNVMIGANTAILWGFMNSQAARGIFDTDPNSVIAGTILASQGRATVVPGGYPHQRQVAARQRLPPRQLDGDRVLYL